MKNSRRIPLLLAALTAAACGGAAEEAGAHAHETAHEAPKLDPHHIAEDRTDCEDDVVLPDGALERYGIEVAPARELALAPTVAAPGHLALPQGAVALVGSAVVGRVVELRVRSGETVSAGDTLLVVESQALGEAQTAYLQARVIAKSSGPSLDAARAALERATELYDRVQGITRTEVQRREAEVRQAERDQEVARSTEAAAFQRLRLLGLGEAAIRTLEETGQVEPRLPIRAPIPGKVVEVAARLGELVDPEKDRLLVIGDLSTLWAIAEVSEMRVAEIRVGAPARVRVPALQNAAYEGRVAAVSPVLEASVRTVEVRVEVANVEGSMLPGMFLQVEIESSRGAGTPVLAVPDGAVLTVEGRPAVFVPVVAGGSVFCKHEVEVGAPVGEHVPVLAGLAAGDLVVVSGAFRLKAEHGKASAQHGH